MSQIKVSDLSFSYEGSGEMIFEHVSFVIDTDWKLGLIGRNGRGKTTLLKLLSGQEEYRGSILSGVPFSCFPYAVSAEDVDKSSLELVGMWNPGYEYWRIVKELNLLEVREAEELLARPFGTLSKGEQTKLMLAALWTGENEFLLIDEPTNHLDAEARAVLGRYLSQKKGFILVSHDRRLLNACTDHILALNRSSIEVVKGNFASWEENKTRKDKEELSQNEKLKKDIGRLKVSARQSAAWSDAVEKKKNAGKKAPKAASEKPDRGYVGHMAAKMMKRAKNIERRQQAMIEEKEGLLRDIEREEGLKLMPLAPSRDCAVFFRDAVFGYEGKAVTAPLCGELRAGKKLLLAGRNGSGKSCVLNYIAAQAAAGSARETLPEPGSSAGGFAPFGQKSSRLMPMLLSGEVRLAPGLKISAVPQDTSWLFGRAEAFAALRGIDKTLFFTMLRKLDFDRTQLDQPMEHYSAGQKKKVLLAASLCEPAQLYIWDEPFNYVDLFSRMQIERLIAESPVTLLFAEHDAAFAERIFAETLPVSVCRRF